MERRPGAPVPHACRDPRAAAAVPPEACDGPGASPTRGGGGGPAGPVPGGRHHGPCGPACAPPRTAPGTGFEGTCGGGAAEPVRTGALLARGHRERGDGPGGPSGDDDSGADADPPDPDAPDASDVSDVPDDPDDPDFLDATGRALRPPISASWRRSRAAGISASTSAAPQVYDRGSLDEARARHLLDPHLPALRDLLRSYIDATGHLMVVSDADGHVLWSEGDPAVRRAAGRVGLQEGFCWSERSIGTNGIGTALATGAPQYVYSAEHLVSVLHDWSCAGAPVTDPDSGRVIGCVDVSGRAEALHPAAVALVGAAAALAEARLEVQMRRRDEELRERHRHHLDALRGEPGALVTPTGRILLAEPPEWCGRRLRPPAPGEPVALPGGCRALAEPVGELFLLRMPPGEGGASRRIPTARTAPAPRPSAPAPSPSPSPSASAPPTGAGSVSGATAARRAASPDAAAPVSDSVAKTSQRDAHDSSPPPKSARAAGQAHPGGGAPLLTLEFLGDDPPSAWLDDRRLPLTLRHAEILALLALHPRGLNAERLSLHLYGVDGSAVTVRAEIHRLRAQLGAIVGAKPYRLACAVDADFLAVRRLLEQGEVAGAVRLARGDLLPHSDAPAIRAERDELSVLLRSRLLDHGDIESLWTYACSEPGRDDLEVLERLQESLPPTDVRRATIADRLHRLLADDDWDGS